MKKAELFEISQVLNGIYEGGFYHPQSNDFSDAVIKNRKKSNELLEKVKNKQKYVVPHDKEPACIKRYREALRKLQLKHVEKDSKGNPVFDEKSRQPKYKDRKKYEEEKVALDKKDTHQKAKGLIRKANREYAEYLNQDIKVEWDKVEEDLIAPMPPSLLEKIKFMIKPKSNLTMVK